MKITVIGLGKIGLPLAISFAMRGFLVTGVDKNRELVLNLQEGQFRSPEPGLHSAVDQNIGTSFYAQTEWGIMAEQDVVILVLPTPTINGRFSLHEVLPVAQQVGTELKDHPDPFVILGSTVMPGQGAIVKREIEQYAEKPIGYAYVPEFVALGAVMGGFLRADYFVIGADDMETRTRALKLYHALSTQARLCGVDVITAEAAKLFINFTVAAKIALANVIGHICAGLPGVDAQEIARIVGDDKRIGNRYFQPAAPYGGPCFPRDVDAVIQLAYECQGTWEIPLSLQSFNDAMYHDAIYLSHTAAGANGMIAVLGLAFKPQTACTEGSLGFCLCEELEKRCVAWDEFVRVPQSVRSAQDAVDAARLVVLCTNDPMWRGLRFYGEQTIFDPWGVLAGMDVWNARYVKGVMRSV